MYSIDWTKKHNKTNKSKAKVTNKTKKKKEEKLGFWNRIENEIHSRYVRLEFGLSLSLSFFPWYFSGRPRFYFPHRYKSFSALTSARMSTAAIFQAFVYRMESCNYNISQAGLSALTYLWAKLEQFKYPK